MPLLPTASSTPLSPTASAMSVSPSDRATLMVPTPATSPTASAMSPAPTSPLASPAAYHGITTVASSTRKRSSLQSSTSRGSYARHLVTIPLHDPRTPQTLLLSLFNARSVSTSRKKTEICNFIIDNDVDIMFLTETWLRPSGDEAKCADLAPPGFSDHSILRSPGAASCRGAGIAFIFRDSLKQNVSCSTSFPFYRSFFQVAQLTLTLHNQRYNFFCIYRPPPNKKNAFTDTMFFFFFFFLSIPRIPL